ncbi:MAG: uroporphyrinogen decarboxylase family protein [Candidatus Omnitrophota bacterium]
MKNRERFRAVMNFQPVDRLPMVEWAGWWNKTIDRWHQEGLPPELTDAAEIRLHLGLDDFRQCGITSRRQEFPSEVKISSVSEYEEKVKRYLYPEKPFDPEPIRMWAEKQKRDELVVWITLEGFFWFPRTLLGIAEHLYAFYDAPELIHRINQDLLKFNLRAFEQFCTICTPDFMTFAEDMSYNHGPMISKPLFDEFILPYYRQIIPVIKKCGTVPVIDSDGDIRELIGWFSQAGVDGFLPLERQAGVDIRELRERYPKAKFIGGYDKMVMSKSEEEIRAEFERLLPVMKKGGYIPSVDHQTPPGVSLDNYNLYLRFLSEYCLKVSDRTTAG